jgi:hypothetical protein
MTPFVTLPHGFAMTRRLAADVKCQVSIFARGNSISIAVVQFLCGRLANCRPMPTPLKHGDWA